MRLSVERFRVKLAPTEDDKTQRPVPPPSFAAYLLFTVTCAKCKEKTQQYMRSKQAYSEADLVGVAKGVFKLECGCEPSA